jgi:hypothetical protein
VEGQQAIIISEICQNWNKYIVIAIPSYQQAIGTSEDDVREGRYMSAVRAQIDYMHRRFLSRERGKRRLV